MQHTLGNGEAIELHQQALAQLRELGDQAGAAEALIDIGKLRFQTRAFDDALENFAEALECAREIGSQLEQAHALEGIAQCRIGLGDAGGLAELREAIDIYGRIGAPEATSAAAYLVTLQSAPPFHDRSAEGPTRWCVIPSRTTPRSWECDRSGSVTSTAGLLAPEFVQVN